MPIHEYISAALLAAGLIACWRVYRQQAKLYEEDQREQECDSAESDQHCRL